MARTRIEPPNAHIGGDHGVAAAEGLRKLAENHRADDGANRPQHGHVGDERRCNVMLVLQKVGIEILRPVREEHHERHQDREVDEALRVAPHRRADRGK
jgi:hypothetical protein